MKKEEKNYNEKAQELTEKVNALAYALHLVKKELEEAKNIIKDYPNHTYILEWEDKAEKLTKHQNALDVLLTDYSNELANLTIEHETQKREEKNLGYVVKIETFDMTNNNELKHIYFLGKDGFVEDDVKYCEPYTKKGNAKRRIKNEVNSGLSFVEKVNESTTIESKRWLHKYSIVIKTNQDKLETIKKCIDILKGVCGEQGDEEPLETLLYLLPFENAKERSKWVDLTISFSCFEQWEEETLKIAQRLATAQNCK